MSRIRLVRRFGIHMGLVLTAIPVNSVRAEPGWCLKTDMNRDRERSPADVGLFVDALVNETADPTLICSGDANADLVLDARDIASFVRFYLDPDSDGDGVPNLFETYDGVVRGPTALGTNPLVPDTDEDALNDGDEAFPTLDGLDLHAFGCSPVRKTILIEADWFDDAEDGFPHSHRPTAGAINMLRTAFDASPVINPPSLETGVDVIVDYGQGPPPFTGGNLIPGGDTVVVFDLEFNSYKAANFAPNRDRYFHYAIFAHRYNDSTNNSSGIAELPGDDFLVTLQIYLFDPYVANTIMHELGHNLNLRHGGFQNLNFKPNYNSVMNYRYHFGGVDSDASCDAIGDGITDYSRGFRIPIDEGFIEESQGVCGGQPIDWNGNQVISDGYAWNITCYEGFSYPCGSGDLSLCYDRACTVLTDHDDWSWLSFSGILEPDLAVREWITCQDVPSE